MDSLSVWNQIVERAALESLHLPIQALDHTFAQSVSALLKAPGSSHMFTGATGFNTIVELFARLLAKTSAPTSLPLPNIALIFTHHTYEVVSDYFGNHPRIIPFLETAIDILDGKRTIQQISPASLQLDAAIDVHIQQGLRNYLPAGVALPAHIEVTSGALLWLNLSAVQLIYNTYQSSSAVDAAIIARFRARYSGVLATLCTGYGSMLLDDALAVRRDSVLISATLLAFCKEIAASDWKVRLWLQDDSNVHTLEVVTCRIATLIGILNDLGTFLAEATPPQVETVIKELLHINPDLRQALAPGGMKKSGDTSDLLQQRNQLGNTQNFRYLLQLLKDATNAESNIFLDGHGEPMLRLTALRSAFATHVTACETMSIVIPHSLYNMLHEALEFHKQLYTNADYYNNASASAD